MARPWIGFRLECGSPLEPFLTGRLAGWLELQREQGLLGRWFYLWYTERGYHLRLRLQPARGQDPERLSAALQRLEADGEPRISVQRQIYDRRILAFGETRESVLGELLHETTSELALCLLAADGRGPPRARDVREPAEGTERVMLRRRLLAAAATAVLLRRAIGPSDLDGTLAAWIAFAAQAAARNGIELPDVHGPEHRRAWLTTLPPLVPRVERALDEHPATRRAVALLRRARERGDRGRFVATHALHLFCNELGMAFDQEYAVATAVRVYASQTLEPAPELAASTPAREARQA